MTRGAAGAIVALAAHAACWTGPDAPPPVVPPPPPKPAPIDVQVSLERTACFGSCPSYSVVISGEGAVTWNGVANVRELGIRRAKVPRVRVEALAAAIDQVGFFDFDEHGASGCSDTSHAIVVVRRGGRVHRVDDARCPVVRMPAARLVALEELIERIAGVARWR